MARACNTLFKFVLPSLARRVRRAALLCACVVAAALVTQNAQAHEIGLSRGEYAWQPGRLLVAVTFARKDLAFLAEARGGPTGADEPGFLAFEEHRDQLGSWLVARLSITADGKPCAGSFDGMRLEGDGVALAAAYTCQVDVEELRIEARFVSELGRDHRHLVHFESDDRQSEEIATAENPFFVFRHTDAPSKTAMGWSGYVRMGIEHILTGCDHLLLLLGLVLLGIATAGVIWFFVRIRSGT